MSALGRAIRHAARASAAVGVGAGAWAYLNVESTHNPPKYKEYHEPNNEALVRGIPTWKIGLRICHLALWMVPLMALWLVLSKYHASYLVWCRMFKRMLELTGPAFVKFGQWCAVRTDIFPKEFCEILSELHSDVTPHSMKHTRRLIKENLGGEIEELFTDFGAEPIGSGSIAQVYFGTLKESGEEVAIKVCHPKIREKIAVDFYCIQYLAGLADSSAPWMDYSGIARQFVHNLSLQVDLRHEAENLRAFRRNFEKSTNIVFPEPIISSELVLVETKIDAQPLSAWFGGDGETSPAHRQLAQAGADLFLQMVLTDNFFHADIHPGNCLVGTFPGTEMPFLAMLDVGVCQTLNRRQRDVSYEFLRCIVLGDWDGVGQSVLNMSETQEFCDQDAFRKQIRKVCDDLMPEPKATTYWETAIQYGRQFGFLPRTAKKVGFTTDFVGDIFSAIQKHHVRIDPAYAHLLFSCVAMEFISNQCDPSMDMVTHSAPWFVSSAMSRPRRVAA